MGKVWFGAALGAILGIADGLTAWFAPSVRDALGGIVVGSTIKGAAAGILAGWFAKKVHSWLFGTLFGLAVGAVFALGVAAIQHDHYVAILIPGSLVGAIAGFATQMFEPKAQS
jgi:hypothetical protein